MSLSRKLVVKMLILLVLFTQISTGLATNVKAASKYNGAEYQKYVTDYDLYKLSADAYNFSSKDIQGFNYLYSIAPSYEKGGVTYSGFHAKAFEKIVDSEKIVVITFEGTTPNSIQYNEYDDDLLNDISIFFGLPAVWQLEPAREFIKMVSDDVGEAKLILTGHSLGGFLAQKLSIEIIEEQLRLPNNLSFIGAGTFNAPGFMNPASSKMERFENFVEAMENLTILNLNQKSKNIRKKVLHLGEVIDTTYDKENYISNEDWENIQSGKYDTRVLNYVIADDVVGHSPSLLFQTLASDDDLIGKEVKKYSNLYSTLEDHVGATVLLDYKGDLQGVDMKDQIAALHAIKSFEDIDKRKGNFILPPEGIVFLDGTNGWEWFIGNGARDFFEGKGGNDYLTGGFNDDNLHGGPGDDIYEYKVNDGKDRIREEGGVDTLIVPGSNANNIELTFVKGTISNAIDLDLLIQFKQNSDTLIVENYFIKGEGLERFKQDYPEYENVDNFEIEKIDFNNEVYDLQVIAQELDPGNTKSLEELGYKAYLKRAEHAFQKGDYEEALSAVNNSIDFREDVQNLLLKANIFYNLGKCEEALNVFNLVLDIEPQNPIALKQVQKINDSLCESPGNPVEDWLLKYKYH